MIEVKDKKVEKTGLTIKKKVTKEAISVLKKLNENFTEGKAKKCLFDDSGEIYLQVTLKKLPPKKLQRMIKIQLPHSLLTDTTEVCLITGDLDKRDKKAETEPTILHYKELLNKHGVKGISEIVPLRQLRTEYKTFESKRQLSAAYDIFLSDKKITGVLPKVLGKAFYEKRKFPIQINLDSTNIKEQVEKAISEIVFPISCRGTSCTSEVARLSMEDNEILENILTCVKSLEDKIPGKGINILGLYVKTAKSQAIPIYMSFDNPNEVKVKTPRHNEKVKAEELSTVPNAAVKVFKDGRIIVKNLTCSENQNSDNEANVKPAIKRKKTSEQEGELHDEEESHEKHSESKKRKMKKEKDLVEKDISFEAEDVKPKIKRETKKIKIKLEDKEEKKSKGNKAVQNKDEQEGESHAEEELHEKHSESKKRKMKKEKDLVEKDISIEAEDVEPKIKRETKKIKMKLEDKEGKKSKRNKAVQNKDEYK